MSNGNSDVKLVHGQVKVEAWDLCVDSKDRRKKDTPHRRALVHDFDDGLTVNWNYDYPGGVTIRHLKLIDPKGKVLSSPGAIHLTIAGNTKIDGDVKVEGKAKFSEGAEFNDAEVKKLLVHKPIDPNAVAPPGWKPTFDVGSEIAALKQKVSELEKQVSSIQDNWRWCPKCQGLFFAGNPTKGVCPAGGEHSLEGSGNYRLLK